MLCSLYLFMPPLNVIQHRCYPCPIKGGCYRIDDSWLNVTKHTPLYAPCAMMNNLDTVLGSDQLWQSTMTISTTMDE